MLVCVSMCVCLYVCVCAPQVFYRERGSSMYNPFAYGIAMALVEVPYLIVQALFFVPTIYWMIYFLPYAKPVRAV
jgi:hypothetical protein